MNTIKMIGKLLLSVAVYAGICFGNVANANENGVILNSALVADDYDYIINDTNYTSYNTSAITVEEGKKMLIQLSQSSQVTFTGAVGGGGVLDVENTGSESIVFTGSFLEFTGQLHAYGVVHISGGPWGSMTINGSIEGVTAISAGGNQTLSFSGDNVVQGDTILNIGHGASPNGTFNFNGHDQVVSRIGLNGSAYPPSHGNYARPTYTLQSASAATLTLTNAVVFPLNSGWKYPEDGSYVLKLSGALTFVYAGEGEVRLLGANTTTGSVIAKKGTITIGSKASFSNGAFFELEEDGHFSLPGGFEIATLKVDGSFLRAGSYSADDISSLTGGRITAGGPVIIKSRPIGEVKRFVWVGNGADDNLLTEANWEGGNVPEFAGGDELLEFAGGISATVPDMVVDINGIKLTTGNAFELKSANNGRLIIGAGGIEVVAPGDGNRELKLSTAIEVYDTQNWTLPETTKVILSKGWKGTAKITESGKGQIEFANDEVPDFSGELVMSDSAKIIISGQGGIGEVGSSLKLNGKAGLSVTAVCATNRSDITFKHGSAQHWAPDGTEFVQKGAAINASEGAYNSDFEVNGALRFQGGVTSVSNHINNPEGYIWWWWKFRIKPGTGNVWIENKPINVGKCAIIMASNAGGCGGLHLNVAGNVYSRIVLAYGGVVSCGAENVLCDTGNVVEFTTHTGKLNLQGCNQTIGNLLMNSDLYAQPSKNGGLGYDAQITSSEPAILKLTGSSTCSPAAYRFMDKAGLEYAGDGCLVLSNETSSTIGPLKVTGGEVRLCKGALWSNCTNIVVANSGKLTLEKEVAAARVFPENAVVDILGGGTIEIPEDETVTVGWLNVDGTSMMKGNYSNNFITGGGTLRVLKTLRMTGFLILIK